MGEGVAQESLDVVGRGGGATENAVNIEIKVGRGGH